MKNNLPRAAALLSIAAVFSCGCSSKNYGDSQPVKAGNITLTAAQRQNLRLYTVVMSKFHQGIDRKSVV